MAGAQEFKKPHASLENRLRFVAKNHYNFVSKVRTGRMKPSQARKYTKRECAKLEEYLLHEIDSAAEAYHGRKIMKNPIAENTQEHGARGQTQSLQATGYSQQIKKNKAKNGSVPEWTAKTLCVIVGGTAGLVLGLNAEILEYADPEIMRMYTTAITVAGMATGLWFSYQTKK